MRCIIGDTTTRACSAVWSLLICCCWLSATTAGAAPQEPAPPLKAGQGPLPQAADRSSTTALERTNGAWVTLEGTVDFAGARGTGGELVLRSGNSDFRVDVFQDGRTAPDLPRGTKVTVSGIYRDAVAEDGLRGPGILLVTNWSDVRELSLITKSTTDGLNAGDSSARVSATAPGTISVLDTVAKVRAISPQSARQQLPVSVRGVVTAVIPFLSSAVIQDSTKGIAISLQGLRGPQLLQRGEVYQVEGITSPGQFAPIILVRRVTHLGGGQMPPPLHATWDQTMNGSLDAQYAEIEGVVTGVRSQQIVLLTEGGKISLDLDDFRSEQLSGYDGARVRVRGCFFAIYSARTHEVTPGALRVMGAVEVLEAAPHDAFEAPQKTIGELLLYDPKAAPFRRLKVQGQAIYSRAGECFLTDGTNGLRVLARNKDRFAAGDLVDAVGYLQLSGPTAELREAVLRKTGSAALPVPTKLSPDRLLAARYAGRLVEIEATLMNQWRDGAEYVLDLQSGFLAFRARVDGGEQSVRLPPSGSQLALSGAYAPQGARAGGGTVTGFQLLLQSPAAIRVLATPPWWTLKRVLVLAGTLAVLLLAALAWNKQLQLKVQQRSRQLETEIRHRQQAELKSVAEAERSRIARDLHDELGTGLAEVNLLASTAMAQVREPEQKDSRFRVIAEKARALISGLDVIVWAIDPRRNSLQSFADYVGRYASELFSASGIVCRFKIPIECDAVTLTEAERHSLFLAVKEALNNVIRHARATEVELGISRSGDQLQVVISDNGRGFDWSTVRRGNGLANLRERLEGLNGQCQIDSQGGRGTTVKFIVPLPSEPSSPMHQHPASAA
jgi:signal transduction histidine kinase